MSIPRSVRSGRARRHSPTRRAARALAIAAALAAVLASLSPPVALGVLSSACALSPSPEQCLEGALAPLGRDPSAWSSACRASGLAGLGAACAGRSSEVAASLLSMGELPAPEALAWCAAVPAGAEERARCACLAWDAAGEPPEGSGEWCGALGGARDRCAECRALAVLARSHPGRAIDACLASGGRRDACLARVAFALSGRSLSLAEEACAAVVNGTARAECRRAAAPLAARYAGAGAAAALCGGDEGCLSEAAREGAASDLGGAWALCGGLDAQDLCRESVAAATARSSPREALALCSALAGAERDGCLLAALGSIPPDRPAEALEACWALSAPEAREDALDRAWSSTDMEAYLRTCDASARGVELERCLASRAARLQPLDAAGAARACESPATAEGRDACLYSAARRLGDGSLCASVADADLREDCGAAALGKTS